MSAGIDNSGTCKRWCHIPQKHVLLSSGSSSLFPLVSRDSEFKTCMPESRMRLNETLIS